MTGVSPTIEKCAHCSGDALINAWNAALDQGAAGVVQHEYKVGHLALSREHRELRTRTCTEMIRMLRDMKIAPPGVPHFAPIPRMESALCRHDLEAKLRSAGHQVFRKRLFGPFLAFAYGGEYHAVWRKRGRFSFSSPKTEQIVRGYARRNPLDTR
ncbi:hypothetical protein ACSMXM_01265 [Pacificimonas sp. ICDLI1SI03]